MARVHCSLPETTLSLHIDVCYNECYPRSTLTSRLQLGPAAHQDAMSDLSQRPDDSGRLEIGPICLSLAVLIQRCGEGSADERREAALRALECVDFEKMSADDAARVCHMTISLGGKVCGNLRASSSLPGMPDKKCSSRFCGALSSAP